MAKIDVPRLWSLNYRLMMTVISSVASDVSALGLEPKELFVLAQIEESPHPAELAVALAMPKPTVTVYLKRLEAAGFVRREVDAMDLRRHRLIVTPAGRKVVVRGHAILSEAFGARLTRLTTAQQSQLEAMLEKMN